MLPIPLRGTGFQMPTLLTSLLGNGTTRMRCIGPCAVIVGVPAYSKWGPRVRAPGIFWQEWAEWIPARLTRE